MLVSGAHCCVPSAPRMEEAQSPLHSHPRYSHCSHAASEHSTVMNNSRCHDEALPQCTPAPDILAKNSSYQPIFHAVKLINSCFLTVSHQIWLHRHWFSLLMKNLEVWAIQWTSNININRSSNLSFLHPIGLSHRQWSVHSPLRAH